MSRQDLSALDRDIGQTWSRIIQEAFKHGIDCDIIQGGLLTGKTEQGLYAVSTIKNYILGTRRITPDGRVYKYSRAGAIVYSGNGAQNIQGPFIADDGATSLAAKALLGATTITIATQTVAANALVGGYVIIYPNGETGKDQFRKITANTLGEGTTITVTLDGPLSVECAANSTLCAYYSPYYSLSQTNDPYASTLCVPAAYCAGSSFFWGQTWGPCRCSPGAAGYGADSAERQMCFGGNGSLFSHTATIATSAQYQHAGFIIPKTTQGNDDAPLLMLQISV